VAEAQTLLLPFPAAELVWASATVTRRSDFFNACLYAGSYRVSSR
jgi:hypothetical protein